MMSNQRPSYFEVPQEQPVRNSCLCFLEDLAGKDGKVWEVKQAGCRSGCRFDPSPKSCSTAPGELPCTTDTAFDVNDLREHSIFLFVVVSFHHG